MTKITSYEINNIIKYIKYINTLKENLNIDFINNFIEYIDKDELYIKQSLTKYLYVPTNIIDDCKNIINSFDQYNNFNCPLTKISEVQAVLSFLPYNNIDNYQYYLNPKILKILLEIFLMETYDSNINIFRKYLNIVLLCIDKYSDYQKQIEQYYSIYKDQIREQKITSLEQKITSLEQKIATLEKNSINNFTKID